MIDAIVATGGSANFYPLLRDLLNSPRDRRVGANVGVLDVGIAADPRRALETIGDRGVKVKWDIDFPARSEFADHLRALPARPFLRRYIPGLAVHF